MAYSAALPLLKDPNDGFVMLKKLEDLAKQNLKMVLYTEPGERVADSNFGVGIKTYLFEQNSGFVMDEIKQRINSQVRTYLPYITIEKIVFSNSTNEQQTDIESNLLQINILFSVSGLNKTQLLQIT